jgi:Flp pilus assembly protein TadG
MLKNGFYHRLAMDVGSLQCALRRDRRGNVAMMFALMALPLVALMGLGIDYYKGLSDKSRLDAASDAASMAAISAAQQYISANSQTQTDPTLTNNAEAAGVAQARKAFMANAGTVELAAPTTPQISVTRSPGTQTLAATVTYAAQTPTSFGGIVGVNTLNIGGTSTASLTMGKYLDFYLLLDVSGSMGLPSDATGQAALAKINPDLKSDYPTGCMFACHFAGYAGFGRARSASPPIPLRVDTVGAAVQQLLQTASATQTLANQFRIGVYPFINDAIQAAALSSSIDPTTSAAATIAANLGNNYLDQGTTNSGMGSGGTHFENLWGDLSPYLKGAGDGSSAATPQAFIFIVTDGADDNQVYTPPTSPPPALGDWTGAQPGLPSLTLCTNAKAAGYVVSVLYVKYLDIEPQDPGFDDREIVNMDQIIPSIPGQLQSCASPGFFFTANSSDDIISAMQAMFKQALQTARLTN